jgi:DNA-binding response OmpR family regulator
MQPTILLVDDDGPLTAALRRRLRSEPYRVLSAASGEDALRILEAGAVDVVVSDEQMPGMPGIELVTEIHRRWPEVVTLMLSGQASIGTVIRALNQGQIHRFLIKPCGAEELAAHLRECLAHKLVMDRCRVLLPICRRMQRVLSAIETRHPGMTRSVESDIRTVVVGRDDFRGLEELALKLDVAIVQGAELLPTPALERKDGGRP